MSQWFVSAQPIARRRRANAGHLSLGVGPLGDTGCGGGPNGLRGCRPGVVMAPEDELIVYGIAVKIGVALAMLIYMWWLCKQ